MLTFLEKAVLGPNRQLRNGDLKKMTERHPFSMYLNYNSYAREYDVYVNNDQTLGLLWECSPLAFASEKTLKSLEGIFRSGLPGGSVVQFILYADPYITPLLDAYKAKIVVENPVIHNNVEKVIDFLYEGKNGLDACAGIPIRNFRLFVAVKIPGDANNMPKLEDFEEKGKQAYLENIQRQIAETLRGAKLFPHPMRPGRLLKLLRRLFNSYPGRDKEHNLDAYDDGKPLHMQIINAETVIKEESDSLQVGEKYFACITPKSMPKEVDALQTNSLFGGIWGLTTDMDQIKTGFLYTLSILFDDSLNTQIRAKCAFLMNQKGFGTLAAKLQKKQNEYLKATDELEHGVKFIRIVPELLVWSDNQEKTRESCIHTGLIRDILVDQAKKGGVEEIVMRDPANSIEMRPLLLGADSIFRARNFIDTTQVKEGYFGGYFSLNLKNGEQEGGFYAPFKAEAFLAPGESIGGLEQRKTGKLAEIATVTVQTKKGG